MPGGLICNSHQDDMFFFATGVTESFSHWNPGIGGDHPNHPKKCEGASIQPTNNSQRHLKDLLEFSGGSQF